MPPEGFQSVSLSDSVIEKLNRMVVGEHPCETLPEAVEYAVDECLAQKYELTDKELAEMLANRLE